ncbi:TPA: fumarate hydratase [Candidatus Poribacteria bacterium]|nr:fumarate hydratase [Candidatus Poribacteria bacterium]
MDLTKHVLELIRRTSTDLPADVVSALEQAHKREKPKSAAERTLAFILENIKLAKANSTPICQDTGTVIYHVYMPFGYSMLDITAQIHEATVKATELAYLRPNTVDSITGQNSGNNIGIGSPTIEFHEWEDETVLQSSLLRNSLRIDLMLKGGGCENVGAQYSLPNSELKANRDLEGVKKVVLDAIYQAQGRGCAPGIIGVGIGGDRGTSMLLAKKQLFRKLDDPNPIPELADAEEELLQKANTLKIGPMGFGGMTTVLGIQMGAMHRIPASYFISIAYMCWADRRGSLFYRDGRISFDA